MKMKYLIAALLILGGTELNGQAGSRNFYEISRGMNKYFDSIGKKTPEYKHFKRWEWYEKTRVGAGGQIVDKSKLNLDALRSSPVNRTSATEANTGAWTALGPSSITSGNYGIGRVNRLAFHPTDVNTLYAASATGGLWITTDGGLNWYSYSEGIPNMSLTGVVVHPTNPAILYILTGDGDAVFSGARRQFRYGKASTGVLKTYDGGFTWHRTGLQWAENQDSVGYKLMMRPGNPETIMVATRNGIRRSTDGGNTWASLLTGNVVYDIEFHPTNNSIVYASGTDASDIVFWKSTNGGQTFTATHTINREDNAEGDGSSNRSNIAVTANNTSVVYLLAGPCTAEGEFQGVFRSTDIGESFTLRADSPNILGGSSLGNDDRDQEHYDLALAADPENSNRIITGGIRVWTSTNGGTSFSWQDDNASITNFYHADIHDLTYHPLDPDILYMCCDGGVYVSTDHGDTWFHRNNGLQVTQYYKFSINPSTGAGAENVIIGGTQDNGTNKRTFTGSSTFTKIAGADGMDCYIDPDNTNHYVVSAQDGVFYYSTDAGSNFFDVGDPESIGVNSEWVTPVSEISGSTTQFVIGYQPAVLATRIGSSFVFAEIGWSGLSFVKTARNNANRIYIGDNNWMGTDNRIMTSTDKGENWSVVLDELRNGVPVTDLAFNPDNGSNIWITFGGYSQNKKVWFSSNSGNDWSNMTGSLPNVPINCIVFDDNNGSPSNAVYIGTDIGVFYRDDNTNDWIPFSNRLPVVEVTDLEIHESEGLLRAATYGRGFWETTLYSGCPANINLTTSNTAMFMPYYYQASQTITSTAWHLSDGANVFYKAGTSVTLSPGFIGSAIPGNIFEAAIGPCGGGVPARTATGISQPLRGILVD